MDEQHDSTDDLEVYEPPAVVPLGNVREVNASTISF